MSTSPQTGYFQNQNSTNLSMREHLRRINFDRLVQHSASASRSKIYLNGFDCELKTQLPKSPFDAINETDEKVDRDKAGNGGGADAGGGAGVGGGGAGGGGGDSSRRNSRDRDSGGMFEDDIDTNAPFFDEDMPFAWAQSDNASFMHSNSSTPIVQVCAAPPPLISFPDSLTMFIDKASLADALNDLKNFRNSLQRS